MVGGPNLPSFLRSLAVDRMNRTGQISNTMVVRATLTNRMDRANAVKLGYQWMPVGGDNGTLGCSSGCM